MSARSERAASGRRRSHVASALVAGVLLAAVARGQAPVVIPAGDDGWVTRPGTAISDFASPCNPIAAGFFGAAVWALFTPTPSIFFLLVSMFLSLFAFLIFGLGALAQQARETRREIWRMRRALREERLAGKGSAQA